METDEKHTERAVEACREYGRCYGSENDGRSTLENVGVLRSSRSFLG
jgi:hypothetical protein